MRPTVPLICEALVASRLLPPDEVEALRARWAEQGPPAAAADPDRFTKWLVANEYVTEYQAERLVRGRPARFFIGPYKLLDRVSRDSPEVVYKALHRLGQTVALKVLPPSKARDPGLLARFRREAELALRPDHPNVVRSFEAGEEDGVPYLVMEYLEGETLESLLRRPEHMRPAAAVGLIRQALLGLQHLYELGLVHRNLEPANLMVLAGHGKGPVVKVLDLSRARSPSEGFPPSAAGATPGRPEYTAPELFRDADAADVRSDVYSLGCVLYHCLTGRPPFNGASPEWLALRPLRESNPGAPAALDPIVARMLARDPAERYPTPERAVEALDDFLAGKVAAPPEPAELPRPDEAEEFPAVAPSELPPPEPPADLPASPRELWAGEEAEAAPPEPEADLLPPPSWRPRRVRRPQTGSGRVFFALVAGALGLLLAEAVGWFLGGWLGR